MSLLRKILYTIILLAAAAETYSATAMLSQWVTLSSDARETVRGIIRQEVDRREGYSTSQEEKANLNAAEEEKARDDSVYKNGVINANKEFIRAKKRRDDLTTQFQTASSELEESNKNIKTIRTSIENLDNQIVRYEQDIRTQQASLKKWLQTEKQGEALVAVIYTRGFKDTAHILEGLADQASAPLMAQHMGTYIQSFTKVINNVIAVDFIRAIEEGTAKWNNEEPIRVELDKGVSGTTYLRLKRYELYPFQEPKGGKVKPAAAASLLKVAIITSKKDLESFLAQNQQSARDLDVGRVEAMIRETAQNNGIAEENLNEQIKSFKERIPALQGKIGSARGEKESQVGLLKKREEQYRKMAQDVDALRAKRDSAEKAFHEAQTILQEKKRIHESIIIKTALATPRGSQSPAEASAEAIIDKLAEVKNDAKTQHSSSTTEVTNFQLTGESSVQAITDARIISIRLISFINEGDSVRVRMAFRVRTVLEDQADGTPAKVATPPAKTPDRGGKSLLSRDGADDRPDRPQLSRTTPAAPEPAPIRKAYPVLASAEMKDCLFELTNANLNRDEVHITLQVTNRDTKQKRSVALYDANYRWNKSTLLDETGKSYDVSEVLIWQGDKKTTMYEAGRYGIEIDPQATVTVKLIFKKVPATLRTIKTLNLHPFVYFPRAIGSSWQEGTLPLSGIRLTR